MRILLNTILAALLLSGPAFGQTSYKEAKALLNEASAKMKSYSTIKIEFSYKFENTRVEPPVVQNQQGHIAIKGNDYHLKLDRMEQIRSGNKLYNILPQDEEVQVTTYDAEEDDQGLTPDKILNLFNEGYSYKLGGTEKVNGKTIRYVILKPTASEEIDKIMIGIEDGSKHIYSMKQWGTNGTVTTLQVEKFIPNPALPQGYFKFSESNYPGYYIAR